MINTQGILTSWFSCSADIVLSSMSVNKMTSAFHIPLGVAFHIYPVGFVKFYSILALDFVRIIHERLSSGLCG